MPCRASPEKRHTATPPQHTKPGGQALDTTRPWPPTNAGSAVLGTSATQCHSSQSSSKSLQTTTTGEQSEHATLIEAAIYFLVVFIVSLAGAVSIIFL